MAKQNVLTRAKKNKAQELFRGNQLQEAKSLFANVCQSDRTDIDAWVMLGIINRKLGLFQESEDSCRHALALKPNFAVAQHVLGTALQCQGKMAEALDCYRRAIELQPDYAEAHYLLGNALRETGALSEAAASYRQAIALQPDFVEALSNLGALLTMLGEMDEALGVLNRAVAIRPAPQVLCNLGGILQWRRYFKEALEKYQLALKYDPHSLDAITNIAVLLEKTNQLAEAQALLERELPRAPENPLLNLVAAKMARREGRLQESLALLEKLSRQSLHFELAGEIQLLMGQIYDRLEEPARAFPCFVEGKRLVAQRSSFDATQNGYQQRIDRVSGYLTDALSVVCKQNLNGDQEPSPVFLIGFPRSGTTLLEQILDSHPALQTMEEKGAAAAMEKVFLEMAGGRENVLAELTVVEISRLRQVYFDEVAHHLTLQPGALLVDKMPLNTVIVHLLLRVFPEAKFILAIRHPCDVCLSCFMQYFAADEVVTNFFTLENTAQVYASVMGQWQKYVAALPLNYRQIRYEDLLVNFERETRALLDFLGVGWDDAVLGHTEHAIKRGTIGTPSYHQVTQPIYQHAKYRWRRYTKEFEPVFGTLRPFIEYFGYGDL